MQRWWHLCSPRFGLWWISSLSWWQWWRPNNVQPMPKAVWIPNGFSNARNFCMPTQVINMEKHVHIYRMSNFSTLIQVYKEAHLCCTLWWQRWLVLSKYWWVLCCQYNACAWYQHDTGTFHDVALGNFVGEKIFNIYKELSMSRRCYYDIKHPEDPRKLSHNNMLK